MQASWELACRLSEALGEAGEALYSFNYRFSTKSLIKDFLIEFKAALMIHEYLQLQCVEHRITCEIKKSSPCTAHDVPCIFGMSTYCTAVLHVFKCYIMFFESGSGQSKLCKVPIYLFFIWKVLLDPQPCMHGWGI